MFLGKCRSRGCSQYQLWHDLVYFVHNGTHRLYVPDYRGPRSKLLHDFHDLEVSGQFGYSKTYNAVAQHYYWPHMAAVVQDYVRRCPICERAKTTQQPRPEIHPLPTPRQPFAWITLDWVSGLPTSKGGNDGYLAVLDRFSKWAIVVPCTKRMTTAGLIDIL